MLKLTYTYKKDKHKKVTVLSDPQGIRDLFWQLTRNYKCDDGTEIGDIKVSNLDGLEIDPKEFMQNPHEHASQLSKNLD